METSISSTQKNKPQNPNSNLNSPSPSPLRQWRPAAQRNIRNQWSNLLSSKDRFFSASNDARNHATSLVNAHLSHRYLPHLDLEDLKDMRDIGEKAGEKLAIKQQICCSKLLSSYKDMVAAVAHMVQSSCSMRRFLKVSSVGSLVQFCDHPEDVNDTGDGGGIPVFTFFSISNFESLAQELVGMFLLELNFKLDQLSGLLLSAFMRLLVVELLNINYKEGDARANLLRWSHELYPGEFDDLRMSNMLSDKTHQPLPPQIKNWQSGDPFTEQYNHTHSSEVLQVYLTTWLVGVNIDMNRIREIFSMVEDEIQVKLS